MYIARLSLRLRKQRNFPVRASEYLLAMAEPWSIYSVKAGISEERKANENVLKAGQHITTTKTTRIRSASKV